MRGRRTASARTGLFLAELIIMLLIFALCAAVCMRMFGAAQVNSDRSRDLNWASLRVQSAAECYKAAGGDVAETARLLGRQETPAGAGEDPSAGSCVLSYYDGEWAAAEEEEAAWVLCLDVVEEGLADIWVSPADEEEKFFYIRTGVVYHGE
ncbi:MAG: hypothetical protein Q4C22_00620 [Bacillota bacterium]|nr:hypothetical protein [Bacillota bacterium]